MKNNNLNNKNKKIYPFGNYEKYYGYRQNNIQELDERVQIFQEEWFCGQKCLDIGCNIGKVTIEIAKKFNPSFIIGIDIDEKLIEKANHSIDVLKKKHPLKNYPISFKIMMGPLKYNPFPYNISFIHENFLEWEKKDFESFDVIICLSTTKWIHLNWGDEGIKLLFKKIYNFLNEGGIFILEPQKWKSYKKKSNITPEIKENYKKIQFKPEEFHSFLINELNFHFIDQLSNPNSLKGFQRPIFIYQKPFYNK